MIFSQKNVTVKNVHLITKPFSDKYIYIFIIYTLMFVYMFDIIICISKISTFAYIKKKKVGLLSEC